MNRKGSAMDGWGAYGFSNAEAVEWISHGFNSPAMARAWKAVTDDPVEAGTLSDMGMDPRAASGWMRVVEMFKGELDFEKAYHSVNGNHQLALGYAKHFRPADWSILFDAGVAARSVSSLAQLVVAIEDRVSDSSTPVSREEIIHEATLWLGASTDNQLTRVNLVQNLIRSNITISEVPFALVNSDLAIPAVTAIRLNNLVMDAGLKGDDGIKAYRILAEKPELESERFASLLKIYGAHRVITAVAEGGMESDVQLEHYLKNGSVAEIARGVL